MSKKQTSIGLRNNLVGPFFFGLIAILCLAAEWLSFIAESWLRFNDISGGNISFKPLCLSIVYIVLPETSTVSSYISELVILSRPNELWWCPWLLIQLFCASTTWWLPLRGGVDGLRGNPKSSSDASDRLFRLRKASASSACRENR